MSPATAKKKGRKKAKKAAAPKRPSTGLAFPPASWVFSSWQREGWEATRKLDKPVYIDYVAGRGAGKDILAERCALRDILKLYGLKKQRQARGELREVLNPLVSAWVIAPQENNLKQAWEDWKGMLSSLAKEWSPSVGFGENERDWLFREVVRENMIVLFGRGEIEIQKRLTSTRDALRGPGVDVVHSTESSVETVPGEFDRAYKEELPGTMTRAGRLGRIYFSASPKGPFGGYYADLDRRYGVGVATAHDSEAFKRTVFSKDGLSMIRRATSFDNELLSKEQVSQIEAERANGWMFEQERLGLFVVGDLGGERAFERAWVEKCIVGMRPAREGWRQIVFGVDIARLGDDETCYLGVDDETGDVVRVEFYKKRTGTEVVADLERLEREFPGAVFYVDSTGHRGYIADFAPSRLSIHETQFSRQKEKWVGGLKMLLQMGKLRIPDPDTFAGLTAQEKECLRKLIRQLLIFVRTVKQSGTVVYGHPAGDHDDGADALILATMRMATRLQETLGAKGTKDKMRGLVI
jgi:hypothetical protein